ncbi:3'(2'),5'-bisphosphate nucleotidase CysQ [Nocardioides daphniae]|uniref:3'(2'),5-bisphosphonucleoside 3'(2')-phosphohydrolase n=1 Tax=Nocardioides daphniae TaxID=402297 RepID=A0A4P7U8S6_9ACTN|nr:3'(2'),5'-bisphosphate nucleotidase CysQ [Nocardioides daphniae]
MPVPTTTRSRCGWPSRPGTDCCRCASRASRARRSRTPETRRPRRSSRRLAEHRPDDRVLSEEASDDRVRLEADRVWIIDPLDGTREFSEPPRDDWAVHVALWEKGAGEKGDLTVGAVAQPALGETFNTAMPSVVPPRTSARPRIAVSRSRPPAFVEALAAELDAELVPMGSAGVKVMSVVRDVADAYVHAGGQYEWDNAAPVAVARAAGLFCSRVDGSELVYNKDDVQLPDLIVCRPELADAIVDFVKRHGVG